MNTAVWHVLTNATEERKVSQYGAKFCTVTKYTSENRVIPKKKNIKWDSNPGTKIC